MIILVAVLLISGIVGTRIYFALSASFTYSPPHVLTL